MPFSNQKVVTYHYRTMVRTSVHVYHGMRRPAQLRPIHRGDWRLPDPGARQGNVTPRRRAQGGDARSFGSRPSRLAVPGVDLAVEAE